MVDESIINKVFTDVLLKCNSLTLTKINGFVNEIIDDSEISGLISKNIYNWVKNYWSSNTEHIITYDYEENKRIKHGKEHEVEWDEDVVEKASKEGLLFSIHNHPNTTSFQSGNDLDMAVIANVKYNITIGKDGLMLIVNNNPVEERNLERLWTDNLYWQTHSSFKRWDINNLQEFEESHLELINNLKLEFENGDISYQELNDKLMKHYQKFMRDNITENIESLEDELYANECNFSFYYLPV